MAQRNYYPTTQNFVPGSYGCGSFIVATLLCFIVIGVIVFIYMLIVKPPGVLTVTYEYRASAPQPLASVPPPLPQQKFFLFFDNAVQGPLDKGKLLAMRSIGKINSATPCCVEGSDAWVTLGDIIG